MISGIDVSRWEPPEELDYPAMFAAGYKFNGIRCTVGNYYQDGTFDEHWGASFEAGCIECLTVVAPSAMITVPGLQPNNTWIILDT
jgi:hypothetical protein